MSRAGWCRDRIGELGARAGAGHVVFQLLPDHHHEIGRVGIDGEDVGLIDPVDGLPQPAISPL